MRDWLRLPARDWSQLPDDVMIMILNGINAVEDLSVFSSICRSWRSVAIKELLIPRVQLPWLLLPENGSAERRGFFSIDRNKQYNVMVPGQSGRRCWGSRYGWLLVLEFDRKFYLFNPLTQVRLDLPPKPIFYDEVDHDDRENRSASVPGFVRKAFVFRDGSVPSNSEDQLMVVALGNVPGNLSLARPGERNWIQLKTPFGRVESAAWCNGRLFVINCAGTLFCCEADKSSTFGATKFASEPKIARLHPSLDNISLVEFFGDLLLVLRDLHGEWSDNWHKTEFFHVYKLDFTTKEWVELANLGDRSLFVDADNSAMSVCKSDVKECKENCIYFVEKYWDRCSRLLGGPDMGVFNMACQKIEPYFISDASAVLIRSNPIWVMPSLC